MDIGFSRGSPDIAGHASDQPMKVLVVDDSLVVRSVITHILVKAEGFKVASSVGSAADALDYLARNRVDIVLLDIEMPGRTGLEALPDILKAGRGAKVLVLSSLCEDGAPAVLRALSLGACDTLAKPGRNSYSSDFSALLITRLRLLHEAKSQLLRGPVVAKPIVPAKPASSLECLAIGASTGGIQALYKLLGRLDSRIDAPILVTQHLPANFLNYFVEQLDAKIPRKVMLARDGAAIARNTVYVAPGNAHLTCRRIHEKEHIFLTSDWGPTPYCPSVDPMLASVAKTYGDAAAAVILSGMGQDGLIGSRYMADAGCAIYVQDPASSVVWGMPGVVAREGLASAVLDPAAIADVIVDYWLETT
ncbi:MAG: chemotaxis protein CheB [Blastomonas sp.]